MSRVILAVLAASSVAACAAPPARPIPERLPAPGASSAPALRASPSAPVAAATLASATAAAPAPARGGDPVAAALAAPDRPADQRARDGERQSAAVLALSGIGPGQHVLDLGAYTGYSTWLLSGLVGPQGSVVAQNPQEWFAADKAIGKQINALRAARPNVTHQVMGFDRLDGDPGSFDAVFSGLVYHDTAYMDVDRIYMNRKIFELLRPGGVYVVVDHRAAPGSGTRVAKTLHRIDPDLVRREVENAGFRLEAESQVLTRAGDDLTREVHDPSIRGKTSQFVYKFVKPAT